MALIKQITFADSTTATFKDNTLRETAAESYVESAKHLYAISVSDITTTAAIATSSSPINVIDPFTQEITTFSDGSLTVSNGSLASTADALSITPYTCRTLDDGVVILVDKPSGYTATGQYAIHFGSTQPQSYNVKLGFTLYLTSTSYPDRWFAGINTDSTYSFQRLQEINEIPNPVKTGTYNLDDVSLNNGKGTTSSASSNPTPKGSATVSYSSHTHGIGYETGSTFSGTQEQAAHSHDIDNSSGSNFTGTVSGSYTTLDTTKLSSEKAEVAINGSNFNYAKPKQADAAGATTIEGKNFSYLKTSSVTGEAGGYTVKGFKYAADTITVSGTLLSITRETKTVTGEVPQGAHIHSIDYTSTSMSGTQTIGDHTHSVSTASANMSGTQTENNHTHTVSLITTPTFVFDLTDCYYYTPKVKANSNVTINGSNFNYDKADSPSGANTAYSFTISGTFDFQHTHNFTLNYTPNHSHTISIWDKDKATS